MSQAFERRTHRLYNSQPLLAQHQARVTKVGPNYIELDSTAAYPEGGGQAPDHGTISHEGVSVVFDNVQKMYTNTVCLENFPSIEANGVVWHYVREADQGLLAHFAVGQPVVLGLDMRRRCELSIYHSASHVLYMAANAIRPGVVEHVFGCSIKPDGARFDFYTSKFSETEIADILAHCETLVQAAHPIAMHVHADNDDAKYWQCAGVSIPCGGTHIDNTGLISSMAVKRKGLGAGKERLMCTCVADIDALVVRMQAYTAAVLGGTAQQPVANPMQGLGVCP